VRETIGAEALHAPALVVHADQEILAHVLHLRAKVRQLLAVLPVARKQDHAAHQRMRQAAAVVGGELQARHVEDDGCVFVHVRSFCSTTTKLAA
jgi:hypothetical protein